MGQLTIGCDGMNGQIKFDTVGTGAIDYMATTTYPPNNVDNVLGRLQQLGY
jgi:hypothetical protein